MIDKNKVKKNFSSAENYDNHTSYHNMTLAMISKSIKNFNYKKTGINILNILDVGCGTAKGYESLIKNIKRGSFNYFGLDMAAGLLNKAKIKINRISGDNANACLICGDAELMPFQHYKFDVIFSNITLHWLNDIDAFLSRCKFSLKDDGIMIFSFLISGTLNELRESFKNDENGAGLKFHEFPEIEHFIEQTCAAGLKIEYSDVIKYIETAESSLKLLKRMNLLGAKNANNDNRFGTGLLRKGLKNYDIKFRNNDNMTYCTYKIAYLILSKK